MNLPETDPLPGSAAFQAAFEKPAGSWRSQGSASSARALKNPLGDFSNPVSLPVLIRLLNVVGFTPSLLIILAFSLPFQMVSAKPPKHRILIPLTQKMEPIFDTSNVPKPVGPFKLGVEHKEIIDRLRPMEALRGRTGIVDLTGQEKKDVLRGQISQERNDSTVDTREYGVRPFYVNFRKLEAKYAPEIARALADELADAHRKMAAEVSRQEKLMNQELKARQPIKDTPILPGRAEVNPDDAKKLKAELAQSKQQALPDVNPRGPQLKSNIAKNPDRNVSMPVGVGKNGSAPPNPVNGGDGGGGGGGGAGSGAAIPSLPMLNTADAEREMEAARAKSKLANAIPKPNSLSGEMPPHAVASTSAIPTIPKLNTSIPEKALAEKLANAKLQANPNLDVNAKLLKAKHDAQLAADRAKPDMDAILTSLHTDAGIRVPGEPNEEAAGEVSAQGIVKWDEWHSNFAALARDPILKAVSKSGNPAGSNTIEVRVSRSHHVEVSLVKSDNPMFGQAILEAYASLDGNPALEYPVGSRRKSVTFFIDNKHANSGAPSAVKSLTTVGDKEVSPVHK